MRLINMPGHGLHIPLAVFQGMVLERIGWRFPEVLQWLANGSTARRM